MAFKSILKNTLEATEINSNKLATVHVSGSNLIFVTPSTCPFDNVKSFDEHHV